MIKNMIKNKDDVINVLLRVNADCVFRLQVMLISLFENNTKCINIYCIYDLEDLKAIEFIHDVCQKYNKIFFAIKLNDLIKSDSNTINDLIEKSYHILMAYQFLPEHVDRILYLRDDVIINGNIDDFYTTEFDNNYMIVRGQTYEKINGEYHRIGARPEKGQYFDTRVLLLNLSKFRKNFQWEKELLLLTKYNYEFELMCHGILNIIFESKVKYISQLEYNFRLSIYEKYIENKNYLNLPFPVIICFECRDYYKMGVSCVPWELTLTQNEIRVFKQTGIIKDDYDFRKEEIINYAMLNLWWKYAKKNPRYSFLKLEMLQKKKVILEKIRRNRDSIYRHLKVKALLKKLTYDMWEIEYDKFYNIKYKELEMYIDSLDKFSAIKTMKNLFIRNCKYLSTKKSIKVAFLVYSSAEWQCEELYRFFEKDNRFTPVIVLVSYACGTKKNIQDMYKKTYNYFYISEKNYNIECIEYFEQSIKLKYATRILEKYDVLVYVTPFRLLPNEVNILERTINQLCIHIPYAYYLENKNDAYYKDHFYDNSVFKLSWFYFESCKLQKEIVSKSQRLNGYNVLISGFPKVDSLIEHTYVERKNLWKIGNKTKLKVIWAPHFNLANKMNGTFHENYRWFYEFAKENEEISWIVRPHPRMEWGTVKFGVFNSVEEYRKYISDWNNLPNATVIEGGDYYDVFESSNAMILDSLSFLAEYQFTGKPLLLLQPQCHRTMSELGEKLVSVLYTTRGNNYKEIEAFLKQIIKGIDPLKEKRKEFRNIYLDYMKHNKENATKYIINTIIQEIYKDISEN